MKVKDVMTKGVRTCGLDSDLSAVAKEMWMRDCGVLPVVDDAGQVVGILTDRDICIAAGSKNREPSTIPVTDVMMRKIHACSPEADIREALQMMREKQVRRLPVLDVEGKPSGILSLDDVALKVREIANPNELSAEDVETTLEAICRRHRTKSEEVTQSQPQRSAEGRKVVAVKPPLNEKTKPAKERTMDTHQPEVFDTTLQKTNIWLKEISDLLHWDDHHKAYHGLRAVLHALRDRLPVPEAAHLGAQLPMLVRGFYYDNWKPAATPSKVKTSQEFYDAVKKNFAADQNVNPMRLTDAVMKVLSANLSPGELDKLRGIFPPHLREIWPKNEQAVDLSDLG